MVAGLEPPREKIKCPNCGNYKIAKHLEDENNGTCEKCGTVWGQLWIQLKDKLNK